MSKPLAIELFAGMFGWGRGLVAEGFHVFGFDIVHESYHGEVPDDCHLVLQDVLTLHGKQFKNATVIVASPPCQGYSYRAMPWSRAKALPPPDNSLFDSCFRIQREASEAAGRYIPLIVENVRGAQKWVGRAKWHYGSFYLWGDVPALMPPTISGVKVAGLNWSGSDKPGYVAKAFNGTAEQRLCQESPSTPGMFGWSEGQKVSIYSDPRRNGGKGAHLTSQAENLDRLAGLKCRGGMSPGQQWMRGEVIGEGTKQGGDWFDASDPNSISRTTGSKSPRRKAAAAQIAQIPFPLAQHIARVFKPVSA